jgi:hypothetical protein
MYITCGTASNPITITVNSNCRIDIILDYCRKEFIRKLNVSLKELKEAPPQKDENGDVIENKTLPILQQIYDQLIQITDVKLLEIIDITTGLGLNCATNLANPGYNTINPHQTYKLGVLDSNNQLQPLVL